MRLFPRTARRRLAVATAVASLAIGAVVAPLAVADDGKDLKHKQKNAHAQVRHAQHALGESSSELRRAVASLTRARSQLAEARTQLKAANAKLAAAQVRDDQMQDRLITAQIRLDTAQQDLAQGRNALDDQREKVADTISDIYEEGDPELLAFSALLDAQTPADLTRQMEARNVIVGRETRAYDDLHAAEVLLEVREGQVEDARDAVEVQRKAAAEHLVLMEDLRAGKRSARDKVHQLVLTRAESRQAAKRARVHDLRALRAAKKREAAIKQRILAAQRRARGGYQGPTNGLFIRPVPGSVTSSFGYREHPIYHYWGLHDGTDFGVSCGEPMRAIAGGTVIARYWSDVYGNRLYVSLGSINGANVTAVYNHATGYRVGVGAHVNQGDVVGYVGSTGWSTGCHLHFTLLVNGNAVDPMNWLP
ncbi:M23 family metallopeptidase [Nocardioides sp. YIM 152315]|uniref:M23 family metallopeptidase n=1 Tax=Nocardioides sp. YIM 152315 TaxID=3031760 RepID=UPI0023DC211A|nr:M23 family metallopeptidase [Nocardioides sp. YIM 152315]MDF1602915.1 peptidoglycan DD-metalloendopeptidase family protein [Nocardioides sp. YIM 152315]